MLKEVSFFHQMSLLRKNCARLKNLCREKDLILVIHHLGRLDHPTWQSVRTWLRVLMPSPGVNRRQRRGTAGR